MDNKGTGNIPTSRMIRFFGGHNIIFMLLVLILIGITVYVFNKVAFIFKPLLIILTTVGPPIILAFVAYYLLNPIVNLLEKIKIKRIWGIIILVLAFAGLFTGLIFITLPAIREQVLDLADNFPAYVEKMGMGFKSWVDGSFLGSYYDQAYDWVMKKLNNLPSDISSYMGGAAEGIMNFASTLTHVIIVLITFPFVLFFLLKDSGRFKEYFLKVLPPKFRGDADHILERMDVQVGSYIQGQIIVATCIGILLYIGYLIIGLDYAITLAIIAAITSVVPYLGPMIAVTPAIIIALVTSPIMLLKMAIVWAAVQFLEGHFISPNIMGRTMQIHPLTIMFVLLVAGNLFGVFGVILAIPGYAILKVLVTYLYSKFKDRYNRFFGADAGTYELSDEFHHPHEPHHGHHKHKK